MNDLWAALALVCVLEGLMLFAFPRGWKRAAEELGNMPDARLRAIGAVILVAGLIGLSLIRG
jgi:uncharacterized protein